MDDDRTPPDRDAAGRPASARLGDLLRDAETPGPPAAGTPVPPRAAPRPPAFRGDAAFRDDRFDDARDRETYGVSLADEIAAEADDRPLASPWTRLGAQRLDGLAFGALVVPVVAIAAATGAFEGDGTRAIEDSPSGVIALAILLFVSLAGYQLWLLSTQGQTIGKRLLKLRIVDETDGSNPGFVRAVLLRAFVPGAIANIPRVGGVFSLVDVLFIFRDDRKCIHDHLAKTVVVTEAGR